MAGSALPRQTLEVGARCVSSARRDLCGWRPAMAVPTAIVVVLVFGARDFGNAPVRYGRPVVLNVMESITFDAIRN